MPSPRRTPNRRFHPHTVRSQKRFERYHGTTDDTLPELARHWSIAAGVGDPEVAARWCERAAEAANRSTAWEEAATLYHRAAELTGSDAEPEARDRRLLSSAKARLHCDEITAAVQRSIEAAEAARRLARPDLLAETCLIAENAGPGPPSCWDSFTPSPRKPLADLGPDDHALRARLLGQLAVTAFYIDPAATEPLSREALAEADISDADRWRSWRPSGAPDVPDRAAPRRREAPAGGSHGSHRPGAQPPDRHTMGVDLALRRAARARPSRRGTPRGASNSDGE